MRMPRAISVLVACCALLMVTATTASAARPKVVSPKRGAVLPLGSVPKFVVSDGSRNARRYNVFMRVAATKTRSRRTGDLLESKIMGQTIGTFAKMTRKRSRHSFQPPQYSFPTWFMNRPGKYYWQAYRIDCRVRGCHIHSKLSSFVVR